MEQIDEDLRIRAYLGDADSQRAVGRASETRFDALVAFVAGWFVDPLDESVLTGAEMDRYAVRLPHAMPQALREWCRLVGTRPDRQEAQNGFCTASALDVLQRDYGLAIYCENQSNWEYFIRHEDMQQADPIVWLRAGADAAPTTGRLSECLFAAALDETVLLSESCGHGPFGTFRGGAETIRRHAVPAHAIARLLGVAPPYIHPFSPWRADLADFHRTGPWEVRFHGEGDLLIAAEGPVGAPRSGIALVRSDEAVRAIGVVLQGDG